MGQTVESELTILNALGLHARAAAQLVKIANRYKCLVTLEHEGQTVNGKSIMGVLMLAAAQGSMVRIRCEGEDGPVCLAELTVLVGQRFGEAK